MTKRRFSAWAGKRRRREDAGGRQVADAHRTYRSLRECDSGNNQSGRPFGLRKNAANSLNRPLTGRARAIWRARFGKRLNKSTAKARAKCLTAAGAFDHGAGHERPFCNLRHLPEDYSLATIAGCGCLFSTFETKRRPASRPMAFFAVWTDAMELKLYDTLDARRSGRSSRSIPTTCACMCAGRRSMTSPISAMRGR